MTESLYFLLNSSTDAEEKEYENKMCCILFPKVIFKHNHQLSLRIMSSVEYVVAQVTGTDEKS